MNIKRRNLLKTAAAFGVVVTTPQLANAGGKVNFQNWADFIGENNIPSFTKKTGVKVAESFIGGDDEIFAKLVSKQSGNDVIVPTGVYVPRMVAGGLLEKLDHSKLPNLKHLSPAWQNLDIDPKGDYQVPLVWGSTGIGYNNKYVKQQHAADCKYLLESGKYSGQIAWADSSSETFEMGMYYLGWDGKTHDKKLISEVKKLLIKQKKYVKLISTNLHNLLISGEVNMAITYNGDMVVAGEEDPTMAYEAPTNGGMRWVSSLAIPKNAPNYENALKFINHMMDPAQSLDLGLTTQYAITNKSALDIAPDSYKNNPALFPSDEVASKLGMSVEMNEEYYADVERAWTEVKAS